MYVVFGIYAFCLDLCREEKFLCHNKSFKIFFCIILNNVIVGQITPQVEYIVQKLKDRFQTISFFSFLCCLVVRDRRLFPHYVIGVFIRGDFSLQISMNARTPPCMTVRNTARVLTKRATTRVTVILATRNRTICV